MKIMVCPLNGPRSIDEFAYGGPVEPLIDPATLDAAAWADHVFMEENLAGIVREWWMHVPSGYWFIAERDTQSDEIVRTFPAREVFGGRFDFPPREGAS